MCQWQLVNLNPEGSEIKTDLIFSTWDYLKTGNCYINGYYTSSACSIGKFMLLAT
jgi:hypothetical protein